MIEHYDALDSYSRQHPKTTPAKLSAKLILLFPKNWNSLEMTKLNMPSNWL
jgi:hypothetical protein